MLVLNIIEVMASQPFALPQDDKKRLGYCPGVLSCI